MYKISDFNKKLFQTLFNRSRLGS